jgi:16S rRNA C967 or C1407 C5-methylase (RsmB/RsmF family)
MVGNGGRLVAITCSLEAEENETIGERFLVAHRDFAPVDLMPLPTGLATHVEAPGRWRVLPDGDHDGFTVQVFARRKPQ